jgi:hypothetical protein
MARYRASVPFPGPGEVAFDYLANFDSVAEWDPGVVAASRLDDGPLAVGSRFRVLVRSGPRDVPLVYEVAELEVPRRIRLVAETSTLRSDDVITVESGDGTSTVTYDADVSLRGFATVLAPFFGPVFRRIGDRARAGLERALADLAAQSSSA